MRGSGLVVGGVALMLIVLVRVLNPDTCLFDRKRQTS